MEKLYKDEQSEVQHILEQLEVKYGDKAALRFLQSCIKFGDWLLVRGHGDFIVSSKDGICGPKAKSIDIHSIP